MVAPLNNLNLKMFSEYLMIWPGLFIPTCCLLQFLGGQPVGFLAWVLLTAVSHHGQRLWKLLPGVSKLWATYLLRTTLIISISLILQIGLVCPIQFLVELDLYIYCCFHGTHWGLINSVFGTKWPLPWNIIAWTCQLLRPLRYWHLSYKWSMGERILQIIWEGAMEAWGSKDRRWFHRMPWGNTGWPRLHQINVDPGTLTGVKLATFLDGKTLKDSQYPSCNFERFLELHLRFFFPTDVLLLL